MDYEKLHKDTITKLQEMVNSGKITVEIAREICADFIPESEDEKIRKALIEAIRNNYTLTGYINHIPTKDILAWLEKHEEDTYDYKRVDLDKFDERIQEFSDMLEDKPKPYWDGWYEAMEWIRTHGNPFKKQGEQKTVDEIAKEVCKNKKSAVTFLKSTGIMNEKGELADEYKIEQDEQNPVWSEEDEDYYDAIIAKLEVTQDDALLTDNQMKFLKSLKDRVHPQPKQEWSEEDERLRRKLIELIYAASYCDERENLSDWLKSLKDRYTWKPSDEQMEGIECTIKTLRYQLNAGDNRLDSLYADLKKLREE